MRRRELLGSIAAASFGTAALDPIARIFETHETPPARVGLADVQAIERATELYMSMDLARHGDVAAAMARGALRWATSLLKGSMEPAVRERLRSAMGLLADRLGWSTFDAGSSPRAVQLLTFALDAAAKGPDRDLRAHIMLDLSTVLTDMGRPADGVEVLRMALGDERISSAEQANLHAVAARHCAAAGDGEAGLRHVQQAEAALERETAALSPPWARQITFSPGHHDSALGLALFALGDNVRARERLTAAVESLDPGRTRTGLRCLARLAVLDLKAGDHEGGVERVRYVARTASDVQSARITADIKMMMESVKRFGLQEQVADLT
ncbi:hypothetical protein ABZ897_22145 [Nonomuraea sp. NPDC046802]|uniref:hypothetical protein n=1 Tax=Nonomuraea sp. NPDC046802 TaxID=3154919 RepID=UPI0033C96982